MSIPRASLPTRRLARLVLAWFALTLGVAVAAPLVSPNGLTLICSAGGSVRLVADADAPVVGATLDCPLCVFSGAPPPVAAKPCVLPEAPLALIADREPLTPAPNAAIGWQARAPPL